jgi:PPOX class probable F420-dependent enzyme
MSFVETTFAGMAVEFTQEVSSRLSSDKYGWLTTVAKSGQPVPKLVWFYLDGEDVIVYSEPNAAKVRHIKARSRVSLNLDSDGNGAGIIVVGGDATVDAEGADPLADER